MVGVPSRRSAPSGEQQAESHNGCDYTHDQEPDSSVTGSAGEEFRQAGAQQGNPDDALHPFLLLRSPSIIGKEARALLRIVPPAIIKLGR
jgi:hypothetical protein